MSDTVSSANNQPETNVPPRKTARLLGLILIIIAVLLGWYLLVGYLGWQSGQSAMVEEREAEMTAQIERQTALAWHSFIERSSRE